MKVCLVAPGNTIDMWVGKAEADQVEETLTRLMLGTHPAQNAGPMQESAVAAAASLPAPPPPTSSGAGERTAQMKNLAELRDAGILSEAEFAAKKRDLLDRMSSC